MVIWTKRGAIDHSLPSILDRMDIDQKDWIFLTTKFESKLKGLVGCAHKLKKAAAALGYQRTPGLGICKAIFT